MQSFFCNRAGAGKNETGWVKIRDMFVIPLAVKAALGVSSGILSMVQGKTGKAATA